ncbi:hypothetical protein PILCRDRAFT_812564, partial [Piloderma croceum F 1598]
MGVCIFRDFALIVQRTHSNDHYASILYIMGNDWTKMTRQDRQMPPYMVMDPKSQLTLSADHDDHFLMDTSNDLTYYHDPCKLIYDGSRQKGKRNREKQCNTCGGWIDLGNIETGESALTSHERGIQGLAKVASTQRALEDLQHSGNISPHMPSHPNQFRAYFPLYVPFSATSFVTSRK